MCIFALGWHASNTHFTTIFSLWKSLVTRWHRGEIRKLDITNFAWQLFPSHRHVAPCFMILRVVGMECSWAPRSLQFTLVLKIGVPFLGKGWLVVDCWEYPRLLCLERDYWLGMCQEHEITSVNLIWWNLRPVELSFDGFSRHWNSLFSNLWLKELLDACNRRFSKGICRCIIFSLVINGMWKKNVLFLEAHNIHRSRFVALLLSAGCSAWGIRRRQGAFIRW